MCGIQPRKMESNADTGREIAVRTTRHALALPGREASPFALEVPAASGLARAALSVAAPFLERALGLTTLGRLYADSMGSALVEDFPERALEALGGTWNADGPGAQTIPATGPLVLVANHPFGAIDGLVLLALVRKVRRDVKLLGNFLLSRIPEMRQLLVEVDPFGGRGSRATNAKMVRRAVDWTKRGGALIVFPAGDVTSVPAPGGRLIDVPWRHGAARIVAHSGATVVPVCFEGRNSRAFELAGRVHPLLRTALLPRELLRQQGQTVEVRVGAPLPHARLAGVGGPAAVTACLRARTYALSSTNVPAIAANREATLAPIVAPVPVDELAADVARLPAERCLLRQGPYRVFHASAAELPHVLREIGRLREIAFRAVGEGTGRSIDLDHFDGHYTHLFTWHDDRREVVGAYRLALTDVVAAARGSRGLYTHTLFRYGRKFLRALGPAIELGRSFVRVEYQREHLPLALLWRGILAFMAGRPRYQRLFGPVSISASYAPVSRDVIVNALADASYRSPLAAFVRSRRPYRPHAAPASSFPQPGAQSLLKAIDASRRGIPVLLRQYLNVGAATIAVNVDPQFSAVTDVLMVVNRASGRASRSVHGRGSARASILLR